MWQEALSAVFSCLITLFIFVLGMASLGGLNNRDRYKKCPICGKSMSSESKVCKACEYDAKN
jgi:hypothetical protein